MARRHIGQERLRLEADQSRRSGTLDEIAGLIDWTPIEEVLAPVYAAPTRRAGLAASGPVQGSAARRLV